MRRRGRLAALLTGGAVLILAVFLAAQWEDVYLEIYAYRTGWRFVWMPSRVVPGDGKCLNNAGQVAANLVEKENCTRAGLWSIADGTFQQIGEIPGAGPWTDATTINEVGSIVGTVPPGSAGVNVLEIPSRLDLETGLAFYNRLAFLSTSKDGVKEIPKAGHFTMMPLDIDHANAVVGTSHGLQPFSYQNGASFRALKSLDGEKGYAVAINDQGWILGASGVPLRPVLWKSTEEPLDLGILPGFERGFANDLNDCGEAVMTFSKSRANFPEGHRPILWNDKDGYTPIPIPEGSNEVYAIAINNRGDILLSARLGKGDSDKFDYYLVAEGRLRKLPPAPDGRPSKYTSLNDKGWVAGFAGTYDEIVSPGRRGFVAMLVR